MIQGTTPTHIFKIPLDTSTVEEVMIIYAQNDKEVLQKNTNDVTMEGDLISVTLTQEDTFLFNHKESVQIQLRLLTTDGAAMASTVNVVDIKRCLNDEVL